MYGFTKKMDFVEAKENIEEQTQEEIENEVNKEENIENNEEREIIDFILEDHSYIQQNILEPAILTLTREYVCVIIM